MKYSIAIIFCLIVFSCAINKKNTKVLKIEPNEKQEYELLVFDPSYDSYLISHAKPQSFHTESSLKLKNNIYVTNWNSKATSSGYRIPFDCIIDYNSNTEYGLELEYKLYYFFKFIEHKYKLNINN